MKELLVIIALIVLPVFAFSQDKIDSLKRAIASRSGIDQIEPIIQLGRAWWYMDSANNAMAALNDARVLALHFGDTIRIVRSSRMLGIIYNHLSMYKEAEEVLSRALPVAERHGMISEWSGMANSLGMAYGYQVRFDEALKLHFQNLALARERVDLSTVSMSLHNIGVIYYKLKDYRKGLTYFNEVVKVKRANLDDYNLDLAILNIAHCHAYMHQYDSARRLVVEGLSACEGECSKMRLREAEFVLGLADLGENKIHSAETHFLRSYTIAKEIDDIRFQLDNIDYLTSIYITNREFKKAEKFLQQAERIIQRGVSLNLEVIKMYKRFFELYTAVGNHKMASHYQQKYITLKDSLYDEELTNNLMKIEADYLERENKARLKAQTNLLALNEKVIDRQRVVNILIGVSAILLLAVAIVLYRSNRQRKRINKILDERVKLRTIELECNREELLQTARRNSLAIEKSATEMKALLSTIKGWCVLSAVEGEKTLEYMDRVESMSDKLMLEIRKVEQFAEQ